MHVEERDQRPHKEGGDDRPDADDCGKRFQRVSRKQVKRRSKGDAHQIGQDPAHAEFHQMPRFRNDERHRVICGDSQVCDKVERRSQAHDHDTDDQKSKPARCGKSRECLQQKFMRELCNVPQEKQVDDGRQADVVPVRKQGKEQKRQCRKHIECSIADGQRRIEPAHQRLVGVYAVRRTLEKSDADAADHHANGAHQDTLRDVAFGPEVVKVLCDKISFFIAHMYSS